MLEEWKQQVSAGDLIYRDELPKEIKDNLISVIGDYRGLGIENEDELEARVQTLFTGDIIPAREDWETLIFVLQELSTVKEQGAMYDHFIRDVSDSLGVSDLEKIKEFIDYIQTLPPLEAPVVLSLTAPTMYQIQNVRPQRAHDSTQVDVSWDLYNPPNTNPTARISFSPSLSEDVSKYEFTIRAGNFEETVVREPSDISEYQLNLDLNSWFTASELRTMKVQVDMAVHDKRGNISNFFTERGYPAGTIFPQGVRDYQVEYQRAGTNWVSAGTSTARTLRHQISKLNGTYTWRVRARDLSGANTSWALSSPLWVSFVEKPTTRTESSTSSIPYQTIRRNNPDLPQGEERVIQQGSNGLRRITYEITILNGAEVSRATVANEIVTAPVDRIVEYGSLVPEPEPEPEILPAPIAAPVYVSTGRDTATVSWEDFKHAVRYEVWYGTISDRERSRTHLINAERTKSTSWYTYFVSKPASSFSYNRNGRRFATFTPLSPGTTYTFYVRGFNASGQATGVRSATTTAPQVGKPSPRVTTGVTDATIQWNEVANAEYYKIFHMSGSSVSAAEQWAKENDGQNGNRYYSEVSSGRTLRVRHTGLIEGRKYTWVVIAINSYGQNVGTAVATQKKRKVVTKTFRPTGLNVLNGPFYRDHPTPSERYNSPIRWRYPGNSTGNHIYQGEWVDGNWGRSDRLFQTRTGGYGAYGGQRWGNNATYIYMPTSMRNELSGKKITKVTFTLSRHSSPHGWPNQGKPLYLYTHTQTSRGSASYSSMYRSDGARVSSGNQQSFSVNWSRGTTLTFPSSATSAEGKRAIAMVENIANSSSRGFGVVKFYGGSFTSPGGREDTAYLILKNFRVNVTYEDIS